jgi:hypothetical protein
VNHRTVRDRELYNSIDALGNLSRVLAANEGKDELNATLLELLVLIAPSRKSDSTVSGSTSFWNVLFTLRLSKNSGIIWEVR